MGTPMHALKQQSRFFWLRLHSLSGVIPVGLFVLMHFYTNSFSQKGPEAFNARLASFNRLPFLLTFEILFIYAPILFHAALGIWITLRAKQNLASYPLFGNLRYTLQRLSGIGVLLFVAAHVYKTKIEPWWQGFPMSFAHMSEAMSEPLTFAVYTLGILGTTYHLANGLWTFCITWGISVSRSSQKWLTVAALFLFAVLFVVGMNNILGFIGHGWEL
jgi:succinate dehydrogenase / fumarate reductase cytochrome b subunit